jgi:hypothetical protein
MQWCWGMHWISRRIFWAHYKSTVSIITHTLNVSRHLSVWAFFSSFGMWHSCPKFVCTFQLHPVYNNFLSVPLWDAEPARIVSNLPSLIAKPTTFYKAYSWKLKSYIVRVYTCIKWICLPGVPGLSLFWFVWDENIFRQLKWTRIEQINTQDMILTVT